MMGQPNPGQNPAVNPAMAPRMSAPANQGPSMPNNGPQMSQGPPPPPPPPPQPQLQPQPQMGASQMSGGPPMNPQVVINCKRFTACFLCYRWFLLI